MREQIRLACIICGREGPGVEWQLISWAEPEEGQPSFDFVPRCKDRAICRERCEAEGQRWPVREPRRAA